MRTTTERAAEIRAAYKALGWNSRKISVRTEYFSMGSAIDVTIKSAEVDTRKAEKIANGAERISRCQITGEILGGGNRYIHVTHSSECREILARRWEDQLTAALDRLPEANDHSLEEIEGTGGACVGRENRWTAKLWVGSGMRCQFDPSNEAGIQSGAFRLALLLEEASEDGHGQNR